MKKSRPIVIKVGGSLLSLKGLHRELAEFLDTLGNYRVVLLTGGGPIVKVLRKLGAAASLTDEQAHWVCIKHMGDLTRLLSETFPNSVAVTSWAAVEEAWQSDRYPWFVVEPFLRADEKNKDHLPHTWDVSSDSIAAHLAARYKADLILLKSCELPKRQVSARSLAQREAVDAWFPMVSDKVKNWSVRNLPGGTATEIALDLLEPTKSVRPRRKPPRARQ